MVQYLDIHFMKYTFLFQFFQIFIHLSNLAHDLRYIQSLLLLLGLKEIHSVTKECGHL